MKTYIFSATQKINKAYGGNGQFSDLIDHLSGCAIPDYCSYGTYVIIDGMKQWANLVKTSEWPCNSEHIVDVVHDYWDRLSSTLILNTEMSGDEKNELWKCSGFTLIASKLKKE